MRTLLAIVPVAIFLALGTHLCFQAGLQPDDHGYMALRVADNFRTGQGLTFNAGERRDLVDSLLWVGQLSLLSFSRAAPLFLQLLGLVLGVVVLLLVAACPRSRLVGAGAALFIALDGLFVARLTAGGSEPLAALHLLLLYPILRAARGRASGFRESDAALALWAGLAACVRYEFVILALPVSLGAGLREPRRGWAWLPMAAACVAAVLCVGLRWSYFQARPAYWEPWPPTAGSLGDAARVLAENVLRRPLLLIGIALLVAEWMRGRLWLGRRSGLAWGLVALLLFSLAPARGGDVERQIAAILPLAYLLAVEAIWRREGTRPALLAALLLLLAQPAWTAVGRDADPALDGPYARVGQWLRSHTLPGTVVGARRVGAVGYYSGLRVEDVRGRVSPRVAAARRLLAPSGEEDLQASFQPMFRQEPDLVLVLPGEPVPSARTYVPNDDALPEAIRGPFRVYRWAGSPVWRSQPQLSTRKRSL
ncbi:MAG: hypothetical protein JSW67_04110 [Candidatus Latescibacterota bacterium]|nr:MAG: hypothetical protein JSW67_04110 [Candidatus Latescibacterota bacterium]